MKRLLIIVAALLFTSAAYAQAPTSICLQTSRGCQTVSSTNKFPVDATATISFPSIGAAVPATGIYNGINVAGNLRGVTGLALGSTYSQTMAIVDASGNQVTSFGGANASVSATGAAVPASATYVGIISGGNLIGWTGAVTNGGTFAVQAAQSGTWNITNVSGTVSLPTGAATAANQATEITSLATIATNTGAALPAGTANIGNVYLVNQYPVSSIPYTASATGTTGATTATLTGAGSVTTYICGFSVRSNATAAATGNITVTGTISTTMNFTHWTAPLASGIGLSEMIFNPCVPASGTNQSVAVVSPAPGSGGTISVTAWGYKL